MGRWRRNNFSLGNTQNHYLNLVKCGSNLYVKVQQKEKSKNSPWLDPSDDVLEEV